MIFKKIVSRFNVFKVSAFFKFLPQRLLCVNPDIKKNRLDPLQRSVTIGYDDKIIIIITRMWANAQPDGRPAEHRWRLLFNAPKFGCRPLLDAVQ